MSIPNEKLIDAASPGKQLGDVGEGLGKVADGGGKVLNETADNRNNRVTIGILLALVIWLGVEKFTNGNKSDNVAAANKAFVDSAHAREIRIYQLQHEEDKTTMKEQKQDIVELQKLVSDLTINARRLNNIVEINKSKKR